MPWELPRNLDTPALVVDLSVLEANVASMATHLADRGIALRPHAKTHKSIEIARRQCDAGAVGLTVATLGEAEVFAAAGFDDLFIAYPLVALGPKAERLRALAERSRLRVGVDSSEAAAALGRTGCVGRGIEVLIELDSGQHRSGVAVREAPEVAAACRDAGLRVVGVFTFPGHAYAEPGAAARAALDEARVLSEGESALRGAGYEIEVRSGGSTPTVRHASAAPHEEVDHAAVVTHEQRPGVYVFNDRVQVAIGSCRTEDVALVVAATVVSRAGPGRFVVDAGSKALSPETFPYLGGYGSLAGRAATGDGGATVSRLSEHHGVVESPSCRPTVGDVVALVPNHVCPVVDHFDHYIVIRDGDIVDRWPVDARGRLT